MLCEVKACLLLCTKSTSYFPSFPRHVGSSSACRILISIQCYRSTTRLWSLEILHGHRTIRYVNKSLESVEYESEHQNIKTKAATKSVYREVPTLALMHFEAECGEIDFKVCLMKGKGFVSRAPFGINIFCSTTYAGARAWKEINFAS